MDERITNVGAKVQMRETDTTIEIIDDGKVLLSAAYNQLTEKWDVKSDFFGYRGEWDYGPNQKQEVLRRIKKVVISNRDYMLKSMYLTTVKAGFFLFFVAAVALYLIFSSKIFKILLISGLVGISCADFGTYLVTKRERYVFLAIFSLLLGVYWLIAV